MVHSVYQSVKVILAFKQKLCAREWGNGIEVETIQHPGTYHSDACSGYGLCQWFRLTKTQQAY